MEKPFCYDLVIDLTASNQAKSLRPTLHISQSISSQPGARGPSHRLSVIRWTWSDVKLVRLFFPTVQAFILTHCVVERA